MKLGTLRSASPGDGELIVVSGLTRMARASDIASTLQSALDRWSETAPKLAQRYETLNRGETGEKLSNRAALIRRCRAPISGAMAASMKRIPYGWRAGAMPRRTRVITKSHGCVPRRVRCSDRLSKISPPRPKTGASTTKARLPSSRRQFPLRHLICSGQVHILCWSCCATTCRCAI